MTNRFKDFGAGNAPETSPLSFKIHGEEFHCKPAIQGKTLLGLVTSAGGDDGSEVAKMITDFFEAVMLPDSYERFQALLDDPDRIVTVDTLGDISGWLVEEYSTRPTKQPEPSSIGQ